ncbi:MAG: winged helix-turn-helix transcriptional regulator [Candidatus Jordarchaeaceae archaeon]
MKEIELKLISELLKNSRRSDRELAKIIGVSQPTVSQMIKKLEKEGYIKEYTIIPNFHGLGYELLALTFIKLKEGLALKEIEVARRKALEILDNELPEVLMVERGTGLGYNGVIISLHKDYTSYQEFVGWLSQFTSLAAFKTESFLISLVDKIKYRPLTLSFLAEHLRKLEATK